VEKSITFSGRGVEHGMSTSTEYRSWVAMKKRCYNPNYEQFDKYGGRGIKVCETWRDNFHNFFMDMGAKPTLKHTIDRIDCDGDYTPENCRWATVRQQNRNKSTIYHLSDGRLLVDAVRDDGKSYGTVVSRIYKGRTPDEAFYMKERVKSSKHKGVSFCSTRENWIASVNLKTKKLRKRCETEAEAIKLVIEFRRKYERAA